MLVASLPIALRTARAGGGVAAAQSFFSGTWAVDADDTDLAVTFTANAANGSPVAGYVPSVTVDVGDVDAGDSTLAISPSTIDDDGVDTALLVLTLLDTDGNPIPDWPATAITIGGATGLTVTALATATNASGQLSYSVTSTTADTYTMTATANGLQVTQTAALEVAASGSAVPDMADDFSTYTDTTDFRNDPLGLYDAVEETLTATYANVNLDTTVGYGALTQAMRVSFLDATAEGGSGTSGRCTNGGHSAWREIDLPGATTELWLEIAVRFDSDFSFGGGLDWGCSSAREQKLFLFGVSGGTGRFNLECTDGQWVFGYPGGETASVIGSPDPSDVLFDASFHIVRFYLRLGAGGTGRAAYSIDGTLYADLDGVTIDRTAITTASLNETRNQGAAQDQDMHIGYWKAYVNGNDPSWAEFA